jgi:hypothetical protein
VAIGGRTLLIVGDGEEVVGHIAFYIAVSFWDASELSYQLYRSELSGRGYVTESVQLLIDLLFATKQRHPDREQSWGRHPRQGWVWPGCSRSWSRVDVRARRER